MAMTGEVFSEEFSDSCGNVIEVFCIRCNSNSLTAWDAATGETVMFEWSIDDIRAGKLRMVINSLIAAEKHALGCEVG